MNLDPQRLLQALVVLPLFLFSLTVHECAHGWMARRFGDHTAEQMGRLTLDPRPHIDPLGLVMFLLSSLVGFGFGWAKPVPVNLGNCRKPLTAMFWVAAAGPLSNLLQAVAAVMVLLLLGLVRAPGMEAAVTQGSHLLFGGSELPLLTMVAALVSTYLVINIALMMFNLIPVPPLDGGRIAVSLLPPRAALGLARLEPMGFMIVLALVYLRVTLYLIGVPIVIVQAGLVGVLRGLGLA
jgi:Zn-dependent protease